MTTPETVRAAFLINDDGTLTIAWPDVARILGRPHSGTSADDRMIMHALAEADAPYQYADCEGFLDERGWHLYAPEDEEPGIDDPGFEPRPGIYCMRCGSEIAPGDAECDVCGDDD